MSLDSNYNPYTPSYSAEPNTAVAKGPLKGFAKVACIFFIILGALGLLQTMQSILGISMALLMESTPEQQAMNGLNAFPGAMIATILFAFINFAVSVCLLIGGITGLKQKMLGAKLIRFTSGFMVVFKVVETVYGVVAASFMMGPIKEQVTQQMQADPNGPKIDMGSFIEIGMYVGMAFVVLMGLAMLLFYLFTFLKFSKQQTLSQFS
jgi:hypothetical protein